MEPTRPISGARSRRVLVALLIGLVALTAATAANADVVGPITFESSQGYAPGDINGQQGWQKLNPLFDAQVATTASFPAASRYPFGKQALRISDAVTTSGFGDQTFSPGLTRAAGELAGSRPNLAAGFLIGTTQTTLQPGLHLSVSPDDGNGGRMSYLRFEDQADGIHVFFDDVTNPGPLPTASTFSDTDIATISRGRAHLIAFAVTFRKGPHNDVVQIFVDGRREATGRSWEDYYRYDPEQTGNGNQIPQVTKLLFRESGIPSPLNAGNGFLLDGVTLASL